MASLSLALLLMACGGGEGEDAGPAPRERRSTTTTTLAETTTPTPPPTPEDEFLAGLEQRGATFASGGSPTAALGSALTACSQIRSVEDLALLEELGEVADNPGSDRTIDEGDVAANASDQAIGVLDGLRSQFGPETGQIVIDLMAEHLCPEHFGP